MFPLGSRGHQIPCPGAVRPVGQLGHLLFESPVELGAAGVGGDLCGNLDLGSLVFAQAIRVLCGNRVLSGGGRVVDFHFPVTLSQLRPEVAVMPRAAIDGDRVHLTGVRNFDYRSRNDFTVNYEEREILLSHLAGLDFYVSYFTKGPVGHTFVSFIFDNAPPLSISIETRPEVGEGFAPVASLFKQFELIYVVGDERDLVRVRTNYRGEPVYLYRLNPSAEDARRLLLVYLARINELAEYPEFYNLLTNSCTINIVRYANAAGRAAASKKAFRGEHRSESELKTAQRMSAQRSGAPR
jgi:hypothetical protein